MGLNILPELLVVLDLSKKSIDLGVASHLIEMGGSRSSRVGIIVLLEISHQVIELIETLITAIDRLMTDEDHSLLPCADVDLSTVHLLIILHVAKEVLLLDLSHILLSLDNSLDHGHGASPLLVDVILEVLGIAPLQGVDEIGEFTGWILLELFLFWEAIIDVINLLHLLQLIIFLAGRNSVISECLSIGFFSL